MPWVRCALDNVYYGGGSMLFSKSKQSKRISDGIFLLALVCLFSKGDHPFYLIASIITHFLFRHTSPMELLKFWSRYQVVRNAPLL